MPLQREIFRSFENSTHPDLATVKRRKRRAPYSTFRQFQLTSACPFDEHR